MNNATTYARNSKGDLVIPLKIDLRRFLPLSNIKYLPAFAGKLELKITFGTQGLVCCPIGPERKLINDVKLYSTFDVPPVTAEFTPIGDPITIWDNVNTKKLTVKAHTLTVKREFEVNDCYSVIPNWSHTVKERLLWSHPYGVFA